MFLWFVLTLQVSVSCTCMRVKRMYISLPTPTAPQLTDYRADTSHRDHPTSFIAQLSGMAYTLANTHTITMPHIITTRYNI